MNTKTLKRIENGNKELHNLLIKREENFLYSLQNLRKEFDNLKKEKHNKEKRRFRNLSVDREPPQKCGNTFGYQELHQRKLSFKGLIRGAETISTRCLNSQASQRILKTCSDFEFTSKEKRLIST